jgi:hypothetical protein
MDSAPALKTERVDGERYSSDSPFRGSPKGTPKSLSSMRSVSFGVNPSPIDQFRAALTHNRNEIAMILYR